jgi:hypothetical protein
MQVTGAYTKQIVIPKDASTSEETANELLDRLVSMVKSIASMLDNKDITIIEGKVTAHILVNTGPDLEAKRPDGISFPTYD